MMRSLCRWMVLASLGAGLVGSGCKSQPEIKPYEMADEKESKDLLDENVDDETTEQSYEQTDWGGEREFSLPEPPEETSRQIDGEFDDWEGSSFKSFRSADQVIEGDHFWDGRSDTSVRVAAAADRGHVYFAVEVADETVIDAGSADPFADGVVIWLRDPGLAELRENLPEEVQTDRPIETDIGILFTPDGQFWRRDDEGELYRAGIKAGTSKTDEGYRVEVALKVGVLQQVSSFPTPEVAFRVEVIDGDEVERRGEQTHFSTMPPLEEGKPRFALLNLGEGWLPYASLSGKPPRVDALGRWRLGDKGWSYESFEVAPKNWRLLSGDAGVEKAMRKQEVFREVCSEATTETRLVEAYQSKNGAHRVALILCGTRPTDGSCPSDAETRLFWAHLKRKSSEWGLARAVSVTGKPLSQCPSSAADGQALYRSFSFLPLEMLNQNSWAVGWHKYRKGRGERLHESGIWVLNTEKSAPKVGQAQTYRKLSEPRSRELSNSKVYLAEVDRKEGLDICEVEAIENQNCRGYDQKCTTPPRGREVIAHIRTWMPGKGKYERYMMSKHRNCSADFDFAGRDAFLLYHRNDRLGIIRSPKQ